MLKICRRPTLGVVVAIVVGVVVASTRSPRAEGPNDAVLSIGKVLDKQAKDWNKGDLDAFVQGYWNSPSIVFQSGGVRNVGFDAMRESYRKRYQADGRAMGQLIFSEVEILPLSSDSAFVRGRWALTMPDGAKPGGLYTLIFKKFPDGWKIIHDHTSSADAPAAKPAPAPAG